MDRTRQVIVYDMYLSTVSDTAMVLPIPISHRSNLEVEFVDLSEYENFFDEVNNLFPKLRSRNLAVAAAGDLGYLEVKQVGSFEASFVPSQSEFSRLDPRFSLSESILEKLPQYVNYGFVVFKLRKGESNIHPMAFWFETSEIKKLFYPTIHVHDGEVHEHEEFSHTLYAQGDLVSYPGLSSTVSTSGSEILKDISVKSKGVVSRDSEIHRQYLIGELPNKDIWVDLSHA